MTGPELLTISEAAGLLQPHLGKLTAVYWLTDMRRASPCYRQRVFTPPTFVKDDGLIKYPRSEIERLIHELLVYSRRTSPKSGGAPTSPTGPL